MGRNSHVPAETIRSLSTLIVSSVGEVTQYRQTIQDRLFETWLEVPLGIVHRQNSMKRLPEENVQYLSVINEYTLLDNNLPGANHWSISEAAWHSCLLNTNLKRNSQRGAPLGISLLQSNSIFIHWRSQSPHGMLLTYWNNIYNWVVYNFRFIERWDYKMLKVWFFNKEILWCI